jgi:phage terminase small subunit
MCKENGQNGNLNGNRDWRLTAKQDRFVDFFLQKWNGTEAARLAGYSGGENALAAAASRLLRNVKVRNAIERRAEAHGLAKPELLWMLLEQARFNVDDVLELDELTGKAEFSLAKAKATGAIKQIKELRFNNKGEVIAAKFYDRQTAIQMLGRALAMFTDRVDISWREEAKRSGFDPDELQKQLVDEFAALMVGQGAERSVDDS